MQYIVNIESENCSQKWIKYPDLSHNKLVRFYVIEKQYILNFKCYFYRTKGINYED